MPSRKTWIQILFQPLVTRKESKQLTSTWLLAGKLKRYLSLQKQNEDEIQELLQENLSGYDPDRHKQNVARIKQL